MAESNYLQHLLRASASASGSPLMHAYYSQISHMPYNSPISLLLDNSGIPPMSYKYDTTFRHISRALSLERKRYSDYEIYEIITKNMQKVQEKDWYEFLTRGWEAENVSPDFPPPNLLCLARSVDTLLVLLQFLPPDRRAKALFKLRCADGSSLFLNTNWETFFYDQLLHESFGMIPDSDLSSMLLHECDSDGKTILLKIVNERLAYFETGNKTKPLRNKIIKLCNIIQRVMEIVDQSERLHLLLMADSNGLTIRKLVFPCNSSCVLKSILDNLSTVEKMEYIGTALHDALKPDNLLQLAESYFFKRKTGPQLTSCCPVYGGPTGATIIIECLNEAERVEAGTAGAERR